MRSFHSAAGSIVALILSLVAADGLAQGFTPLVFPGSVRSRALGIDGDTIVGWQQPAGQTGSVQTGYRYNGGFSELQFPGGRQTTPRDISGNRIVGSYVDGTTFLDESFIYDNGNWTNLKNPAYTYTFAESVDGNRVAGWLTSGPGSHTGFIYDGNWTTLSYPGSDSTRIFGIDGPNAVGTYRDEFSNTRGFLYDGTNWKTLDFPGGTATNPRAISGNYIVGSFTDFNGATRGFRYDGHFWHTLNLPDSTYSSNNGVDGQLIVGEYTEDRVTHGFSTPAIPGPNEYKFAIHGEITLVEDAGNRFAGAFQVGDPIEGSYNYFDGRYLLSTFQDNEAMRSFSYFSSLGGTNYHNIDPVPLSFQLMVGDHVYETGDENNAVIDYGIRISNDDDGTVPPFFNTGDQYYLQSPLAMPDNFVGVENARLIANFVLDDDSGTALSSLELPTTAPDVSKYATRIGNVTLYDANTFDLLARIEYRIDSVVAISVPLPGDFNRDGRVDAVDYTVWRDGLGTIYTAEQYFEWKNNFGATQAGAGGASNLSAVPEPGSVALALCALACIATLASSSWPRTFKEILPVHAQNNSGTSESRQFRNLPLRGFGLVAATLVLLAGSIPARADIFTWELVNPQDSSFGWQASTTLTPGGAGVNAVPGANLSARDLTKAYLVEADLTNANLNSTNLSNAAIRFANLTNANLTSANLTGAYLHQANLTGANLNQANLNNTELNYTTLAGADFTNAQVRGASFGAYFIGSQLTAAQLYSTASYKSKDLTGIGLYYAAMSGWNFAGQNLTSASLGDATLTNANLNQSNLTGASLDSATLTGASFAGAQVQGASFRNTTSRGFTPAKLYATASYQAKDLTGIGLSSNTLIGWDFSSQNLTNASFVDSSLVNANFTNAQVRGANFAFATLTESQVYSTASYQAQDLSGIRFLQDLYGWNFVGQNLTGTSFNQCRLSGNDFTGANVQGADFSDTSRQGPGFTAAQLYSTASYQAHDLTGINLSSNDLRGWNFAGQNLTGANLSPGYLGLSIAGADFTGASVQGAKFGTAYASHGLTATQLYSTASYQAKQLAGVGLEGNDLSGWNLAGQNLANAAFSGAKLNGANLAGANLAGAYFGSASLTGVNVAGANFSGANFVNATVTAVDFTGATLTGADFSGADTRGAMALSPAATNAPNVIRPNGHIAGLTLTNYGSLTVRDYDGNSGTTPTGPIPITVDGHFTMDFNGSLGIRLAQGPWDSTISFAPGIPVTRDGTLWLDFAEDVPIAPQFGRTYKLFDWTGVSPTGQFQLATPYNWDLSKLYTTGEVTLLPGPIPGDFNQDDKVDAADYTVWRDGLYNTHYPTEYLAWKVNFGTSLPGAGSTFGLAPHVPEPASVQLLIFGIAAAGACTSTRKPQSFRRVGIWRRMFSRQSDQKHRVYQSNDVIRPSGQVPQAFGNVGSCP